MNRIRRSIVAACALCVLAAGGGALAAFPEKPITLLVPFAPGASADGIARIVARELSQSLGQPVVVDNRPGGGGATALIVLGKSAADGYTIGLGATGAIAINPHLPDAAPLKPETQLDALGKLADIPLVLIAAPRSPFATLKELLARARTEEVACGNSGQYTSQHLSAELLSEMTGARFSSIPYKGSSPAVTDVLAGQIPIAVVDLTSAYPHIKSGAVRALGVTSAQRSKVAPELPTLAEAGVPGYAAPGWMGLFLPRQVPAPVIDRLSRGLAAAMAKPEVQTQILALSAEPAYLDASGFAAFVSGESKRWAKVIAAMPAQK